MLLHTSNTLKSLKTKCIYTEMDKQKANYEKCSSPKCVSTFILYVSFLHFTYLPHSTKGSGYYCLKVIVPKLLLETNCSVVYKLLTFTPSRMTYSCRPGSQIWKSAQLQTPLKTFPDKRICDP